MLRLTLKKYLFILSASLLTISCHQSTDKTLSGLNSADFQQIKDDQEIRLFVLTNENGAEACITNYGGRLVSLMMPDKDGKFEDIVCGFPTIDEIGRAHV